MTESNEHVEALESLFDSGNRESVQYVRAYLEGYLRAQAHSVVHVLTKTRGIPVPLEIQERIRSCGYPEMQCALLHRAVTVERAEDLFDGLDGDSDVRFTVKS